MTFSGPTLVVSFTIRIITTSRKSFALFRFYKALRLNFVSILIAKQRVTSQYQLPCPCLYSVLLNNFFPFQFILFLSRIIFLVPCLFSFPVLFPDPVNFFPSWSLFSRPVFPVLYYLSVKLILFLSRSLSHIRALVRVFCHVFLFCANSCTGSR